MFAKSALRRSMKQSRQRLSTQQQRLAARQLANRLRKHPLYQNAHYVAGYAAVGGEIDPLPLLRHADRLGKKVYLPVLTDDKMLFVRYRPGTTALTPNRFDIPEPRWHEGHPLAPAQLDLVLLPLLAFDVRRQRLGMGGGFYDRTFAFKRQRHANAKPVLLGIAHAFQQVDKVPTNDWDIGLRGVATDGGMLL